MRRCSSVLLLAPALALIDTSVAQTIDLDGDGAGAAAPNG